MSEAKKRIANSEADKVFKCKCGKEFGPNKTGTWTEIPVKCTGCGRNNTKAISKFSLDRIFPDKAEQEKPVVRQETGEKEVKPLPERGVATRFKPGQSGNPGGRPKKMLTLISDALREKLKDVDPETRKSYAELCAERLIDDALDGKIPVIAIREIADRTEGKPKQPIDMNINDPFAGRTDDQIAFYAQNGFWPEEVQSAEA